MVRSVVVHLGHAVPGHATLCVPYTCTLPVCTARRLLQLTIPLAVDAELVLGPLQHRTQHLCVLGCGSLALPQPRRHCCNLCEGCRESKPGSQRPTNATEDRPSNDQGQGQGLNYTITPDKAIMYEHRSCGTSWTLIFYTGKTLLF